MQGKEILTKLIHEVIMGISESTDLKVLKRYENILECLNEILKRGCMK